MERATGQNSLCSVCFGFPVFSLSSPTPLYVLPQCSVCVCVAGSVAGFTLSPPELQHRHTLFQSSTKKLYRENLVMIPLPDNSVCVFWVSCFLATCRSSCFSSGFYCCLSFFVYFLVYVLLPCYPSSALFSNDFSSKLGDWDSPATSFSTFVASLPSAATTCAFLFLFFTWNTFKPCPVSYSTIVGPEHEIQP